MHPGVILVLLAVVVFRLAGPLAGGDVAGLLANFSPLAALLIASAVYLPRRAAGVVGLGSMLISLVILYFVHENPFGGPAYLVATAAAFALVFALGWTARGTRSVGRVFATSAAGTLLFFFVSNTASFFFDPSYAKTAGGWVQALTTGVPGFPPTWWFFLKSLAGDMLFTTLMILACHPRSVKSVSVTKPGSLPARASSLSSL